LEGLRGNSKILGMPRQFPEEKIVKVALGTFARSGIEARLGTDLAAVAEAALVHYTRRLKSGRRPVGIPRFCREHPPDHSGEEEIGLPIEGEIRATLEHEAQKQTVSLEQLLVHAVFVYLADLDSASTAREMHELT
jgi:hypothetical protein